MGTLGANKDSPPWLLFRRETKHQLAVKIDNLCPKHCAQHKCRVILQWLPNPSVRVHSPDQSNALITRHGICTLPTFATTWA